MIFLLQHSLYKNDYSSFSFSLYCIKMALLSEQDIAAALQECEIAELNDLTPIASQVASRYVKHLLLHMINDELEHARHVWRRIDPALKAQSPELENVWSVCECLREGKDIPGAFERLQVDGMWSVEAQPLVNQLVTSLRETQADILSKGFTIISEAYALKALGLTDVAEIESNLKWTSRGDGMMDVVPRPQSLPSLDGENFFMGPFAESNKFITSPSLTFVPMALLQA